MKNTPEIDETMAIENSEEGNVGCQVRRKIEDYLERRRSMDELGELNEDALLTE